MNITTIRDGVWSIVNGTETAPTDVRSDAYAKFSGCKNHELATVVLSIDPTLLYLVGDPNDPVVVWQKLGLSKKDVGKQIAAKKTTSFNVS